MDKSFWQAIKVKDFAVPGEFAAVDLIPDLLEALASPDAELRDSLAYEVLGTWVERGVFTPDQLRGLTADLLRNLKDGIGERETDSVFLRAFSILILTEVIGYDANARLLTGAELHGLIDASLEYLAAEQDLRGYVAGKGWAHTAAHTADCLRVLARHPLLEAPDLERLLNGIAAKVAAETSYPYLAMEEDRLGLAAVSILRQGKVPVERAKAWIQSIAGARPWRELFLTGEGKAAFHNAKAFLSSLHLLLEYQELDAALRAELLPEIRQALKAFAPRWF